MEKKFNINKKINYINNYYTYNESDLENLPRDGSNTISR